ncbi:MAG: hypothetical protein AB1749_15005, partial [Pseudomonadota bacterium]
VNMDWGFDAEEEQEAEEVEATEPAPREERFRDESRREESGEGGEDGRRRGRRRRRRGRRDEGEAEPRRVHAGGVEEVESDEGPVDLDEETGAGADMGEEAPARETASGDGEGRRGRRGRRRGRRGGRRGRDRNREDIGEPTAAANRHDGEEGAGPYADEGEAMREVAAEPPHARGQEPEQHPGLGDQPWPVAPRPAAPAPERTEPPPAPPAPVAVAAVEEPAPAPRQRTRGEPIASEPRIERVVVKPGADEPAAEAEADAAGQPVRKGWWLRRLTGSS